MLSMGEASKQISVSKATLSRAIKSGKISARRNGNGGFEIDPSELFRVFQPKSETVAATGVMKRSATIAATGDTPILEARIEALEGQIALLRENAAELKEQRDSWQKQAEQAQRLLGAPVSKSPDSETVKQFQETVSAMHAANQKQAEVIQNLIQKVQDPVIRSGFFSRLFRA